jgi:hypothetical protein
MYTVGDQRTVRKRTGSEVKVKMRGLLTRDRALAMTKKTRGYNARI